MDFIVQILISVLIFVISAFLILNLREEDEEIDEKEEEGDIELGLYNNKTPCEYLRNFTIEVLQNEHHILNINTELRHRIVWAKS